MTREEALKLLGGGAEGVRIWNGTRNNNELPCLDGVDLGNLRLNHANFTRCSLRGTKFDSSTLERASLRFADLTGARLRGVNLTGASLTRADLSRADLTGAILSMTNLKGTDLSYAKLHYTRLDGADIRSTGLRGTDFLSATATGATFASHLDGAVNLDTIRHTGPSHITIRSVLSFKKDMPENFLRGCGLRDQEIAYFRSVVGQPVRFYTCFISYSTADEAFATRLHNDFQAAGIRCWKWNEDAKTGRSLWGEIDQAIRKYDKLVLIASESSLKSPAVNREIERALQQEDQRQKRKHEDPAVDADVLFPVRIDDYLFKTWDHPRKADVTCKVIADAVGWDADNVKYQRVLSRLVRDLKPG